MDYDAVDVAQCSKNIKYVKIKINLGYKGNIREIHFHEKNSRKITRIFRDIDLLCVVAVVVVPRGTHRYGATSVRYKCNCPRLSRAD